MQRNAAAKWKEAWKACQKGLRGLPKKRKRYQKRNVLITKELYEVESCRDGSLIHLYDRNGKKRRRVQSFFVPVEPDSLANCFFISRVGRRFWLSISYDDGLELRSNDELLNDLARLSEAEVRAMTLGIDRGVARQFQGSNGVVYEMSDDDKQRQIKREARRTRYERRMARQIATQKGKQKSNRRLRVEAKVGKLHAQIANVRDNSAHHISKAIVESDCQIIALEKLNITGMTRRPKAKKCEKTGRWLPNGARRKAGLNKAILNAAWGVTAGYIKYKANERGKAWLEVPAPGTSQTCRKCGEKHNTEREGQALFTCHACGHTENADENASGVVVNRAAQIISSGEFAPSKKRKSVSVRRGRSESKDGARTTSSIKQDAGSCVRRTSVRNDATSESLSESSKRKDAA